MLADEITAKARRIHFSSLVFDTHTDTPQRFLFDHFDLGQRDSEGCVDIPRLREGGIGAIFFALWVPVEITGPAATQRALALLDATLEQVRIHTQDLTLAITSEEIRRARREGKIAVLLGLEGGHAINDDLGVLRDFVARGVRYMTLTHNAPTNWADSSSCAPAHDGLTSFGREVIGEMNRLGMMVDASHVSDKTFDDVLQVSRAPVIASHSCCRKLCDAPRNLTDGMIRELAAQGGVIHITFHTGFLSQENLNAARALGDQWTSRMKAIDQQFGENEATKLAEGQRFSDELTNAGTWPRVSWEKIIEHVEHAVGLVGPDHVGLGSDFDGAFMPEGMRDAAGFPKLSEGLVLRGYAEADIRKILGENTLRVMDEVDRVARTLQSEKT